MKPDLRLVLPYLEMYSHKKTLNFIGKHVFLPTFLGYRMRKCVIFGARAPVVLVKINKSKIICGRFMDISNGLQ